MAQKIGYQDGIAGLVAFLRKFPLVKYRPVGDRPASLEQWSWLEKIERTLRILKDDHDAVTSGPVTPTDPPLPPPRRVAPQTYNRGSAGQDARYCTFGLPTDSQGRPVDDFSTYDENGLSLGGRTGNPVPGLKPADEMDGRGPCEPYGPFPPWPTMSYDR